MVSSELCNKDIGQDIFCFSRKGSRCKKSDFFM